jgi:hypothetical protein
MTLSVPRVESPQPDEIPEVVPEVNFKRSGGSSDDDTLDKPEYVYSATLGEHRRNKAWTRKLADAALALPAPQPQRVDKLVTRSRAVTDSAPPTQVSRKRRLPHERQQANQLRGNRCKQPVKGQESPGTKVPKPMETRRQAKEASRAGGLRPVGGSGQTDTCVAHGNPSQT